MKKLAMVLPVLVVIAAVVFFAVHRREKAQHVNREIRSAAATHFGFDQRLELARAACGGGQVKVNAKKEISCSVCPGGSDFARPGGMTGIDPGWTMDGAIPGSFSMAEADEALVHATGCESHANNYGGDYLMRRIRGQWSTIRYASGGTANDKCQKVAWAEGRDALVCEVTDTHAGVTSDAVQLLQFDAVRPPAGDFANALFLAVTDESSNCGFQTGSHAKMRPVQLAKIEEVKVLPAAADGKQDVAIDATIARVPSPTRAGTPCAVEGARRHHLTFHNAGDHFDAANGYVAVHAMKREDCCELTVTPRVVPGRY